MGVVVLMGGLLVAALPARIWPFFWVGAMLALSAALGALSYRYSSPRGADEHSLKRAGLIHTALTGVVGLTWASGAFGAAHGGFNLLAVYSLALGGTALGAVSSQHAVPRSAMVSIWSSVPLLGAAHLTVRDGSSGLPVSLMMLLFAIVLSILCVRMYRFVAANHDLTRSLNIKVEELTRTTAALGDARRQAEDANLAKSRFLAQASHDLRQPIHAIGLLTASLKDTRLSGEQQQIVTGIEQSVDSVTSLFGSLLDISRLDIGGVEPRRGPLDLGAFLSRVAGQNRELAAKSGCSFTLVSTGAWVETDGNLLFTMVQNVLGNAFKYASGRRVLIGPRRIAGRLALQISDTGPGIETSQLDAVFEEYYRLERDGAGTGFDGMGLGLSIVRRLGDLLDLDVKLASEPGRGTTVLISGLESAVPVENAARPAHAHPVAGKRIVLVDDDETVRIATTRLLERWGCIVTAGASVDEIGDPDCDAILADMHLAAGEDGLRVVTSIRKRADRVIPAVILTGRGDRETLHRIAVAGLPVLSKPVRPPELRAMLTRLCLGWDPQRQNAAADTT